MERTTKPQAIIVPRLLKLPDLADYLSVGTSTAQKIGNACGARRKIGSHVWYDMKAIDNALDNVGADEEIPT